MLAQTYQKGIVAVLLFMMFLLCVSPAAHAETNTPAPATPTESALTVSPAIFEQVLTPGIPLQFTIRVQNTTNFPLPVKAFVTNLTVDDNDLSKEQKARFDASQWFTIQDPDFILQPKQLREVSGTIKAPTDALPGGHYGTLFFQPLLPEDALSPSTAYINARVGVLTFIIVKGDIVEKGELKNSLQTGSLTQGGPIEFTFSIKNTGNVHVMPSGSITIYDMFDKKTAIVAVPAGIILPGTTKNYVVTWDTPPFVGGYRAELTLQSGAPGVRLPKTEETFLIIPWGLTIVIVIPLAAIIFIIAKTHHRWGRAWRELRGSRSRLK